MNSLGSRGFFPSGVTCVTLVYSPQSGRETLRAPVEWWSRSAFKLLTEAFVSLGNLLLYLKRYNDIPPQGLPWSKLCESFEALSDVYFLNLILLFLIVCSIQSDAFCYGQWTCLAMSFFFSYYKVFRHWWHGIGNYFKNTCYLGMQLVFQKHVNHFQSEWDLGLWGVIKVLKNVFYNYKNMFNTWNGNIFFFFLFNHHKNSWPTFPSFDLLSAAEIDEFSLNPMEPFWSNLIIPSDVPLPKPQSWIDGLRGTLSLFSSNKVRCLPFPSTLDTFLIP